MPISDLANLLINNREELSDETNELCGRDTKNFIASFICKDIASFKESGDGFE